MRKSIKDALKEDGGSGEGLQDGSLAPGTDSPAWPRFGAASAASTLIQDAQPGRLRSAVLLLDELATKLRAREQLEPIEADFLAKALETAIRDPARAAQALGLVAKRGAPRRGGVARILAGRAVHVLARTGIPLKDGRATESWDGNGAVSRVASARFMTVDQVRRGYTKYMKQRREIEGWWAQ